MTTPVALTIAGSDPSGGAGLQADLKTFHQHGVYGMSVVTLLTVQNTQTVAAVELVAAEMVIRQLEACLNDIPPQAAKTGALGSPQIIEAVAAKISQSQFPLVVDPVMISKHKVPLISSDSIQILKSQLLPQAFLVTPNLSEATALAGFEVYSRETMAAAAKEIQQLGASNVMIKGGHLGGAATDVLLADSEIHIFELPRHQTQNTHGTGCVTAAAITARLALGERVIDAVRHAKEFINQAIRTNPGLGQGFGPVNLFVQPESLAHKSETQITS